MCGEFKIGDMVEVCKDEKLCGIQTGSYGKIIGIGGRNLPKINPGEKWYFVEFIMWRSNKNKPLEPVPKYEFKGGKYYVRSGRLKLKNIITNWKQVLKNGRN